MGYLKTEKRLIESISETIELVELNALGVDLMTKAFGEGDKFVAMALCVKFGTKKWRDSDAETILDELPLRAIEEISDLVTEMSEVGQEKNSESVPTVVSSTG